MVNRRRLRHWLIAVSALLIVAAGAGTFAVTLHNAVPVSAHSKPAASSRTLAPNTRFFVPVPDKGAVQQIASLLSHKQKSDAALILKMVETPQAVWFTGGTPKDVQQGVKKIIAE